IALLTVIACVLLTGDSRAALLNIAKPSLPRTPTDITSNFQSASYNSTSHVLTITGSPIVIDYNNTAPPDYDLVDDGGSQLPELTLSVLVSNTGTLIHPSSGNVELTVTGAIDTNHNTFMDGGETFATLLTADVLDMGFLGQVSTGHDKFDFVFRVLGGTQMAAFGGYAAHVVMVYDAGVTSWTGSWASNFTIGGTGGAVSDIYVPEPSTYLLTLVAAATAFFFRPLRITRRSPFQSVDQRESSNLRA